jgi:hypothetical protein
MKPALALEPVQRQGEVVGTSGSSTAAAYCETHMCVTLVRPCTRICATMTGFLFGIRGVEDFAKIQRCPFVERLWFETRSDALESMISNPKSGASANSATLARNIQILGLGLIPASRTAFRSGARSEFTEAVGRLLLRALISFRRSIACLSASTSRIAAA